MADFLTQKEFFVNNRQGLQVRIEKMRKELSEEKLLAEKLEGDDIRDDASLADLRTFVNGSGTEVSTLVTTAATLDTELRAIVLSNKSKRREIEDQSTEYAALTSSSNAQVIASDIQKLRSILDNLEVFLAEEGVQGPSLT